MAGGLGTRLRPLTERIPKAMVPVNGKPFLLHLLELLRDYGIKDIVLCIGYLGEQIKDYLNDGKDLGLNIKYSEEQGLLLGTGGALKQAQNLLDDYFLVINGDTYLPVDYGEIYNIFLKRNRKALMVVYDNQENTGVKNNVAIDSNLMVIKYDKETLDSDLTHVEAGVLVLERDALDMMNEEFPVSLEKGLYTALIQQRELAAYVTNQRFYDIGTPEQYKIFEDFLGGR